MPQSMESFTCWIRLVMPIVRENGLDLKSSEILQPQFLVEGFHIAKQMESILGQSLKKGFFVSSSSLPRFGSHVSHFPILSKPNTFAQFGSSRQSSNSVSGGSGGSRVPSKGLSPTIMAGKKLKGLCFWCAAKYLSGPTLPDVVGVSF
ncbi:hypothetical protein J1N35_025707 [Gossypium stocksii]|uniref:Uncharacterized protein n=1 Tax=Gossypium stocksii TaxID=47602 RepID=A0A9D3V6X9_9ROSI|nr:hypothetical protein J1N35_025707 [Gossypium stocksii]